MTNRRVAMRFSGTICIVTMIVVALLPATSAFADAYSRQRSGISRWAPQSGNFQSYYFSPVSNDLVWRFSWGDVLHYTELNGRHRALEMKAKVPLLYAVGPDGYNMDNYPSSARPYRDTPLSDECEIPCLTAYVGYGAADANYFLVGPTYFADLGVAKTGTNSLVHGIQVDVRASSRLDHNIPCLPAAICVFNDYTLTLLRPRNVQVRQSDNLTFGWTQNILYNQSFEQGMAGYSVQPGNNNFVYCNGQGFGSNCYLEFNRGTGATASVYQLVSYDVRPGDNYTAEVMLRCPPNQPTGVCYVGMVYWSIFPAPFEAAVAYAFLPTDDQWYLCKVDYEHGGTTGFGSAHSALVFEVQNLNFNNLRVDFTTLALYTNRTSRTQVDPTSPPEAGPPCQLAGQYDS